MKDFWLIIVMLFAGGMFTACSGDDMPVMESAPEVYLNPDDSLAMVSVYKDLKFAEAGLEWNLRKPETWPGVTYDTINNVAYVRELNFDQVYVPVSLNATVSPEIGRLKHLSFLYLKWCNFKGILPIELFNCPLHTLSIYGNENRETREIIPPEIKNSAATLKVLKIKGTNLQSLPEEIAELTQLEELWVHYNELTGMVPGFLFRTSAKNVILESNCFEEVNWYDVYTALSMDISSISLKYNNIKGIIPKELDSDNYRNIVWDMFVPQYKDSLFWYDGVFVCDKK